jgi:hypothetical protein
VFSFTECFLAFMEGGKGQFVDCCLVSSVG